MITMRSFCFSCQVVDLDLELVKTEQEKDENIQKIVNDLLRS